MDIQPKRETRTCHQEGQRNVVFKGKNTKVVFSEKAVEDYEKIIKSKQESLSKAIKQKIFLLKQNPEYGIHIAKKKIPKDYIQQYEIKNLWKINLPKAWRILYTIRTTKIEIISFVLDIIDHKEYDKKFGYKKR